MEISKELVDKLKETYNVFYNNVLNAWTRSQGKWNRKDFDLGKVTELITGDNILTNGNSYVDYQENTEEGHICVCDCPLCSILYRLYHKQTDICFLVGSKCIEKAGHDNFMKNAKCAKKNGICVECKFPLIL
jgi:hypothetical protein